MSDTPIADSHGDESDDPLAERESIVVRSAQRFEPQSTAEDAELAYYLETEPCKARRGGHSAPARPVAPAPQNRNDLHNKDFLGSSEDEFEAAFRSLEKQTSSASMRQGSVFKNEPVFEEPPPQDYSRTFAQTFEEEVASSPGTSGQAFETRADAFDFDTRSVTVTAVTGVVFVAVIGALIYSCVGVKNTGEPIAINTDTSAVKNMAAAETEQPSSSKPIYERLGSSGDSSNERIVSREEQPGDNLQAPDADSAAVPGAPASPPQASSTTPPMILPNPSTPETGMLNAAPPPKRVTKPQAQRLRTANVPSTTPSTVPSSAAGFAVQVSSQKSQDSARASFSSLQERFPQVLTGYQPSIKAVTLNGQGTYYRVRVGPLASRDKASLLCRRLKAAGGDCIVVRNERMDRGGRLLQRPVSPPAASVEESRARGPR